LVQYPETQHFFLNAQIENLPKRDDLVSIRGVVGIENIPSEIKQKLDISEVPLLVSEATPPQFSKLIFWFLPVSLGFLIGIYLVIEWLLKLKKQIF